MPRSSCHKLSITLGSIDQCVIYYQGSLDTLVVTTRVFSPKTATTRVLYYQGFFGSAQQPAAGDFLGVFSYSKTRKCSLKYDLMVRTARRRWKNTLWMVRFWTVGVQFGNPVSRFWNPVSTFWNPVSRFGTLWVHSETLWVDLEPCQYIRKSCE